jgi:hypothetical protein
MPTRAGLEQEIAEQQRAMSALRREVDEMRRYVTANEHALQGMSDSLRDITQEGLAKARANLARKEIELQTTQQALSQNQQVLGKLGEVERKQAEIRKLEQDLETLHSMLERARGDLTRIEGEFLTMTGPSSFPQYLFVSPDGKQIVLPTDRPDILIGCTDQNDRIFPDVDMTPYGGKTSGVSRRHAQLRYHNGQWLMIDLGSANGTYINDVAIQPQVPTPVMDNARLRFGNLAVTFMSAAPNRTVRL